MIKTTFLATLSLILLIVVGCSSKVIKPTIVSPTVYSPPKITITSPDSVDLTSKVFKTLMTYSKQGRLRYDAFSSVLIEKDKEWLYFLSNSSRFAVRDLEGIYIEMDGVVRYGLLDRLSYREGLAIFKVKRLKGDKDLEVIKFADFTEGNEVSLISFEKINKVRITKYGSKIGLSFYGFSVVDGPILNDKGELVAWAVGEINVNGDFALTSGQVKDFIK